METGPDREWVPVRQVVLDFVAMGTLGPICPEDLYWMLLFGAVLQSEGSSNTEVSNVIPGGL